MEQRNGMVAGRECTSQGRALPLSGWDVLQLVCILKGIMQIVLF